MAVKRWHGPQEAPRDTFMSTVVQSFGRFTELFPLTPLDPPLLHMVYYCPTQSKYFQVLIIPAPSEVCFPPLPTLRIPTPLQINTKGEIFPSMAEREHILANHTNPHRRRTFLQETSHTRTFHSRQAAHHTIRKRNYFLN